METASPQSSQKQPKSSSTRRPPKEAGGAPPTSSSSSSAAFHAEPSSSTKEKRGGGGGYFKHSLGAYPSSDYFAACCSNDTVNVELSEIQSLAEAIGVFSDQLNRAMGPSFPCFPDASSSSSTASPVAVDDAPAISSSLADAAAVEHGGSDRPMSVGDPEHRLPLGFDVNDTIQALNEQPLAVVVGHSKEKRGQWARLTEQRRVSEDTLMPFAEAAYYRKIGVDAPGAAAAVAGGNNSTTPAKQVALVALSVPATVSTSFMEKGKWLVDMRAGVLVHVWSSSNAANNVSRLLSMMHQLLFDYRIEGIYVPFTTMYVIHGEYVSVTAMPPLFSRQQWAQVDTESSAPLSSPSSHLLVSQCQSLRAALHLCEEQAIRFVPLATAADGRLYLVDVLNVTVHTYGSLLSERFAHHQQAYIPTGDLIQRYHLARTMKSYTLSMHRFVVDVLIDSVVTEFESTFASREPAQQSSPAMLRDRVLRDAMRKFSVPMPYLSSVALAAHQRSQQQQEGQGGVFRILLDNCATEMVSRAAKAMALYDVQVQASKGFIGEHDQLEAVNRVMRSIATKETEFWSSHLVGVIRRKFVLPSSSTTSTSSSSANDSDTLLLSLIDPSRVHVASVLKAVSSRTGAILLPETNRFEKFASTRETGVKALLMRDPLVLRGANGGLDFTAAEVFPRLSQVVAAATLTSNENSQQWILHAERNRSFFAAACCSMLTSGGDNGGDVQRHLNSLWGTFSTMMTSAFSPLVAHNAQPIDETTAARFANQDHVASLACSVAQMSLLGNDHPDALDAALHVIERQVIITSSSRGGPSDDAEPDGMGAAAFMFHFRLNVNRGQLCGFLRQRMKRLPRHEVLSAAIGPLNRRLTAATSSVFSHSLTLPQIIVLPTLHDLVLRIAKDVAKAPFVAQLSMIGSPTRVTSPTPSTSDSFSFATVEGVQLIVDFVSVARNQSNTSALCGELGLRLFSSALENESLFPISSASAVDAAASPRPVGQEHSVVVTAAQSSIQPPPPPPEQRDEDSVASAQGTITVAIMKALIAALTIVRGHRGIRHALSVALTYAVGFTSLQYVHVVQMQQRQRFADADAGATTPAATLSAGVQAMRKIVEKTLHMQPKQQVQSATALVPLSILYKISVIAERAHRTLTLVGTSSGSPPNDSEKSAMEMMSVIVPLLTSHVKAFGPQVLSGFMIQRVGRGLAGRRVCAAKRAERQALRREEQRAVDAAAVVAVVNTTLSSHSPSAPRSFTEEDSEQRSERFIESSHPTTSNTPMAPDALSTFTPSSSPPHSQNRRAQATDAHLNQHSVGDYLNNPVSPTGGGAVTFIPSQSPSLHAGQDAGSAMSSPHHKGTASSSPMYDVSGKGANDGGDVPVSSSQRWIDELELTEQGQRKQQVMLEVEARVLLRQQCVEGCNAHLRSVHEREREHFLDEEQRQRDEMEKSVWSWGDHVIAFLSTFVARWHALGDAQQTVVDVDEPASRTSNVHAEAKGRQFVYTMENRERIAAEERTFARATETVRSSGVTSPFWEREGRMSRVPGSGRSESRSPDSPVQQRGSGTTSPVVIHGEEGCIARAISPLLGPRGMAPPAALGGEASGDVTSHPIEGAADILSTIRLADVEPWSNTEMEQIMKCWKEQQQEQDTPSDVYTELSKALLDIPTHVAHESKSSKASSSFWDWIQVDAELHRHLCTARQVVLGPEATQPTRRMLRQHTTAWVDMYKQAAAEVQRVRHGDELNDNTECMVHTWQHRRGARLYMRALRALGQAVRELHVPCDQFVVPVAFRFGIATSVVTVTMCSISKGDVISLQAEELLGEKSDEEGGPSLLLRTVDALLQAVFPNNSDNNLLPLVRYHRIENTGAYIVVPAEGLLRQCDDRTTRNGARRVHQCALETHVPDSAIFQGVDADKRLPHAIQRCATRLRDAVEKSGNISCSLLREHMHRSGVPLANMWAVLQAPELREAGLSAKTLENVLAVGVSSIVARALKQTILSAVDMMTMVENQKHDDDTNTNNDKDDEETDALRLVMVARTLRTFTKSTTMLQTYLPAILVDHFNAPLALINVKLVSLGTVVREVCRAFGLVFDEGTTSLKKRRAGAGGSVVSEEEIQQPQAAASSPSPPQSPDRTSRSAHFTLGVTTTPVFQSASAPQPIAFLYHETPCLVTRTSEAEELLSSVLLLQTNRSSPSALYAVLSKALYCDAKLTLESGYATSVFQQLQPLEKLLLHRSVKPSNLIGLVEEPSASFTGSTFLLSLLQKLKNRSSIALRRLVGRWCDDWARDELFRLTHRHAPPAAAANEKQQKQQQQPPPLDFPLYGTILDVAFEEQTTNHYDGIVSMSLQQQQRVEPMIETLVDIFVARASIMDPSSTSTAPQSSSSSASLSGMGSSFTLMLSQKEVHILCKLSRLLKSDSMLTKQSRMILAGKLLTRVTGPTLLALLGKDELSSTCNAYVPLCEATASFLQLSIAAITTNEEESKGQGEEDRRRNDVCTFLDSGVEGVVLAALFCLGKATTARNEMSSSRMAMLALGLQDVIQQLRPSTASATGRAGAGSASSLSSSTLATLCRHHERARDFVRTLTGIVDLISTECPLVDVGFFMCRSLQYYASVDALMLPNETLSAASLRIHEWQWICTSPYSRNVIEALVGIELQEKQHREWLRVIHTTWMVQRADDWNRLMELEEDRHRRLEIETLRQREEACMVLTAATVQEESLRRAALEKEALVVFSALVQSSRDTLEWVIEGTRSTQRVIISVSTEEQRHRSDIDAEQVQVWLEAVSDFYDMLRVVDAEEAAREELYDQEAQRIGMIFDMSADDARWMLELNGTLQASPSPARGGSRGGARPHVVDSTEYYHHSVERQRIGSANGGSQSLFANGTPRERSREASRLGSSSRATRPPIPASPLQRGHSSQSQSRGGQVFDASHAPSASDALGGGYWQRVVTPRSGARDGAGGLDDELPLPPRRGQDDDEDDDIAPADIIAAALSPLRGGHRQGSAKRPPTPPAHEHHHTYPSGLPPIGRVGSAGAQRRPPSRTITPRSLDSSAFPRIVPAEYTSNEVYLERMRQRSEERHTFGEYHHNRGTQTGMTPPPTPKTPMMMPTTQAAADRFSSRPSSGSGRPRSAQDLQRSVENSMAHRLVGLMPAFDILYRSAQREHALGSALAVLFFMDLEGQDAAEMVSPKRIRVPSALTSRRLPKKSFVVSENVQAMMRKVDHLEEQSAVHELDACIHAERRVRAIIMCEDEPKALALIREAEEAHRWMIEDKILERQKLEQQRQKEQEEAAAALAKRGKRCLPPLAAARALPVGGEESQQGSEADEELLDLKRRARAYMHGGPKQLRPAIAADGYQESVQRKAKMSQGTTLMKRNTQNTATTALRALQAELNALDPTGLSAGGTDSKSSFKTLLPPPAAIAAPHGSGAAVGRVSSASLHRSLNPGGLSLPPLSSPATSNSALPPLKGHCIPEMLRSVSEIGRLKREAQEEIARETYCDSAQVRHMIQTHKARPGVEGLPPLAAPGRPISAGIKQTLVQDLPQSFAAANARARFLAVIQSFARAAQSRDMRCRLAMEKILRWAKRLSRRLWARRRCLATQTLLHRNASGLRLDYFQQWAAFLQQRQSIQGTVKALLWRSFQRKCDARAYARDVLSKQNTSEHLRQRWTSWLNFRRRRRNERHVEALALQCNRVLATRYLHMYWRDGLLKALTHDAARNNDGDDSPFSNKNNDNNVAQRCHHRRRDHRQHLLLCDTAASAATRAHAKTMKRYFNKWLDVYVARARRHEASVQLAVVIRQKRYDLLEKEMTRVWCIAMWKSGWARKYLKEWFYGLLQRTLEKHPHLADRKWKTKSRGARPQE